MLEVLFWVAVGNMVVAIATFALALRFAGGLSILGCIMVGILWPIVVADHILARRK